MIPPVPPGQSSANENMVHWANTFDMRQTTLSNLSSSNLTFRTNPRPQALTNRMRSGCETNPSKSLDILRRNLQSAITKDIDAVIKKYMEKFFQPAYENIRKNLGKDNVSEDLLKDVCRNILDEVKLLYQSSPQSRDSSPYEFSDSDASNMGVQRNLDSLKRKESDTDSENSSQSALHKRTKFRNSSLNGVSRHSPQTITPIYEGPKWNPDRITTHTMFIMGARANKALGYGQTRGRLYARHPELLRYSSDTDDKEWLARHNLLPANGGKAYLMILEDINELAQTDEYRNNPNVMLSEIHGFEVPMFLLNKVRTFMDQVRTDRVALNMNPPAAFDIYEFPTAQCPTPPNDTLSNIIDNNLGTPDMSMYIGTPETSSQESNSFVAHNQMQINSLISSGPPTLNYIPHLKRTKTTGFNLGLEARDSQDMI